MSKPPEKKRPEISGILLDVDGTLIDSNDLHARAWVDAFTESGYEIAFKDVRLRIGEGGDHLLPELIGVESHDPRGKALEKRRGEIFRQTYLKNVHAFKQSRQLLEVLLARGYQLVIATSASEKDLDALLKQTHLDRLVELATTTADADRSKPDPDIVHAALKKAHLRPEETLMFGDTPYDIQAAGRAFVDTIAFACGGRSEEQLLADGAAAVVRDPQHLLELLLAGQAPF